MLKFNKRKLGLTTIILLLLLVVLVVNIFDYEFYLFRWLENGVYNLVAFFIGTVENVANSIHDFYQSLFRAQELLQENRALRREISELMIYNISLRELEQENNRLREMLNLEEDLLVNSSLLGARKVGFVPGSWEDRLMISAGTNDGVEDRMPVVSYGGTLLGIIDNAGVSNSQVKLITDPEFSVGARVEREDSRASGIVRGQPGNENLRMERIGWDADISPGDKIVTSGVSGDYPRGLPIGRVIEIEPASYGLSQAAEIDYNLDSRTIEEVFILLDF